MVDYFSLTPCDVRLANGRHQSHMKKCLEFENNAIGHTTLQAANNVGWANYTYIIHFTYVFTITY